MILSETHQFCFIAVPKTGTSSISKNLTRIPGVERNVLRTVAGEVVNTGEHVSALDVIGHIGRERWDALYTFGAVRNPWSRVVSSYHFYRDGRAAARVTSFRQSHPVAIGNVLLAKVLPFRTWVRIYKGRTYLSYLIDERGDLAVKTILKQESLGIDFAQVCANLSFPESELPRENRSEHGSYRDYYDERSREVVARRFRADIEAFGYQF